MKGIFVGSVAALVVGIPSAWAGPLLFEGFSVQGQISNSVTVEGQQTISTEDFLFALNDGARSELSMSSGDQSASAFTEAFAGDDSFTLVGRAEGLGGAEAITSSSWLISFVAAQAIELLFSWDIIDAGIGYGISLNGDFIGEFQTSALFQRGDVVSIDVSSAAFSPSGEYTFAWTASSVAVPEPGTVALLGLGLVGMGYARRKKAS